MTVSAMITGKFHGELRTFPTRNGGRLTAFKMKVVNGSNLEFWDVATFSETVREELDGLGEGAPLSATGAFTIEPWERGERRGFNLKLTADRVLSLKPGPKESKSKAERPQARARVASSHTTAPQDSGGAPFDDDIPF